MGPWSATYDHREITFRKADFKSLTICSTSIGFAWAYKMKYSWHACFALARVIIWYVRLGWQVC